MRDSMHILDQLQQRGYEPQEDAAADEGWFDRHFDRARLRVILAPGELDLCSFGRRGGMEWKVRFHDGTPLPVILAALAEAEQEAGREWWTTQERLDHERHQHAQYAMPCRLCVNDARRSASG